MMASSTASFGAPLIFRRGMTLPLFPACSSFIRPSGTKSRLAICRSLMFNGTRCLPTWYFKFSQLFHEILERLAADALVHASAGRNSDADQQFVRARTVRDRDRDRVIVRADVELVLVRQWNVDGGAGRPGLGCRRNPGKAAADGLAQGIAEDCSHTGHNMLLLARRAGNAALAVAVNGSAADQGARAFT